MRGVSTARGHRLRVTAVVASAGIFLGSRAAGAQQASTPVQIAGEYSALGLDRGPLEGPYEGTGSTGLGVRVEFTLTRRVEVESRLTWFPANLLQEFQGQGGQTLQAAVGIRGKFFVWPRASVYGLLLPGLIHFTDTVTAVVNHSDVVGGSTHFALDTGWGVELYPSSRWTLRAEVSGPLYGSPGTVLVRQPTPYGDYTVSIAARFVNPWQVSAGVGYRMGSFQDRRVEHDVAGRWEIGGQVTRGTFTDALAEGPSFQRNTALGAFASYRVAPAVYADVGINGFLRQAPSATAFDGGYLLQVLGGVKLGVRKDSYGIFGKARVGVNSQSGAFREGHLPSQGARLPIVTTGRANAVAIDVGGVFERYLGRHLMIRFDGSDVLSVFRGTTIVENGVPIFFQAPASTHSLQMAVGLGWRS